jgi:hypothetical protein
MTSMDYAWIRQWLETFALVATLVVVIVYTIKTAKIAKAQEEEVGLRKRPVVSFWLEPTNKPSGLPDLEPYVVCKNYSLVHAKARVKLTIILPNQTIEFEPPDPYSGTPVWHIQAMGPGDMKFRGHFHFKERLGDDNLRAMSDGRVRAELRLESWVINYHDSEDMLWENKNRNPILIWLWGTKKHWIPYITPNDLPERLFDVE